MEYRTKELQAVKSYPTYQFHAFTASDKLPAESVFRICVLETLRWLRRRLNNYSEIPDELTAPDPENYMEFSEDNLRSFNLNLGANLDCTYIANKGVWSFRISEPDTGEDLGTENERQPVNGRVFQTEISFMRHSENVEVGVRTTCSEPADSDAPCSVFRPALVKALANNPEVGFMLEGFRLNGKPLFVTNQTELRNFERLISSEDFDMPLAIVADSGYEKTVNDMIDLPNTNDISFKGFIVSGYTSSLSADISKVDVKSNAVKVSRSKNESSTKIVSVSDNKTTGTKLPVFDYETLALKTMGYAVVCFVSDKCFDLLRNKMGIVISANELVVSLHGNETERVKYSSANMESILKKNIYEIRDLLKRSSFSYGDVLFYSDARLADLREQRHENISLEDKIGIFKQENKELRERNKVLSQQNTDLQMNADNVRTLQKEINTLKEEKESLEQTVESLKEQFIKKEDSYRKSAEIVEFYRVKAKVAARFPTDKDKICDWARECFSDNMIISQRAETALRKYSGAIDPTILCDGIYYLNAYAKYRRGEISSEELVLYAESYNWEATGCGSGALRVRRDDYEVNVDGDKYLMDMHIKYGVSAQVLIRIYFCWDETNKKLIVGYMPDHLATVAKGT